MQWVVWVLLVVCRNKEGKLLLHPDNTTSEPKWWGPIFRLTFLYQFLNPIWYSAVEMVEVLHPHWYSVSYEKYSYGMWFKQWIKYWRSVPRTSAGRAEHNLLSPQILINTIKQRLHQLECPLTKWRRETCIWRSKMESGQLHLEHLTWDTLIEIWGDNVMFYKAFDYYRWHNAWCLL